MREKQTAKALTRGASRALYADEFFLSRSFSRPSFLHPLSTSSPKPRILSPPGPSPRPPRPPPRTRPSRPPRLRLQHQPRRRRRAAAPRLRRRRRRRQTSLSPPRPTLSPRSRPSGSASGRSTRPLGRPTSPESSTPRGQRPTSWTCFPTRAAPACTSATRRGTPRPTSSRESQG